MTVSFSVEGIGTWIGLGARGGILEMGSGEGRDGRGELKGRLELSFRWALFDKGLRNHRSSRTGGEADGYLRI